MTFFHRGFVKAIRTVVKDGCLHINVEVTGGGYRKVTGTVSDFREKGACFIELLLSVPFRQCFWLTSELF